MPVDTEDLLSQLTRCWRLLRHRCFVCNRDLYAARIHDCYTYYPNQYCCRDCNQRQEAAMRVES